MAFKKHEKIMKEFVEINNRSVDEKVTGIPEPRPWTHNDGGALLRDTKDATGHKLSPEKRKKRKELIK